jgi:hypothetical protein
VVAPAETLDATHFVDICAPLKTPGIVGPTVDDFYVSVLTETGFGQPVFERRGLNASGEERPQKAYQSKRNIAM